MFTFYHEASDVGEAHSLISCNVSKVLENVYSIKGQGCSANMKPVFSDKKHALRHVRVVSCQDAIHPGFSLPLPVIRWRTDAV